MIARKIEALVKKDMAEYPAVTLFGPRQCGKTTLAKTLFPAFSYANLEDPQVRLLATTDPNEFFVKFPEPVIIDEIQHVPELLSTVQVRIDKNHAAGQYLFTGSQQIPLKKAVAQSLAGRTAVRNMLPFSIEELKEAGIQLDRDTQLLSGFMPFLYKSAGHAPSDYYRNYIETYVERDVVGTQAIHDMVKFMNFLKLLAGRIGQLVNSSALSAEVGVSVPTINSWISVLEASHILFKLQPWYASRTSQIVKTPKIYFCDTGIAASLLGIQTPSQMSRDPLMGRLFENMIILEAVKVRCNAGSAYELFFFRNSNGLAVDLIKKGASNFNLFEIKSGKSLDKNFTRNMKNFISKYEQCKSDDILGTVIYSGEDVPSFNNFAFVNYTHCSYLFYDKEKKFRLQF